jgi:hypothetical protein
VGLVDVVDDLLPAEGMAEVVFHDGTMLSTTSNPKLGFAGGGVTFLDPPGRLTASSRESPRRGRDLDPCGFKVGWSATDEKCVWIRTIAVACLLLASAGCAGSSSSTTTTAPVSTSQTTAAGTVTTATTGGAAPPRVAVSESSLRAATLRFLDAYDRRDVHEICGLYGATAVTWMREFAEQVYGGRATCNQFVPIAFHSEPTDTAPAAPIFTHVAVVQWLGTQQYGPYSGIAARLKVQFSRKTPALTTEVTFWFDRKHGGLRVAVYPPLTRVLQDAPPDIQQNVAPITKSATTQPAAIDPPSFTCPRPTQTYAPKVAAAYSDQPGYARVQAPWVAIKRVKVLGHPGQHTCVAITFAAPLRAYTVITLNGLDLLVIGSQNNYASVLSVRVGQPSRTFGERGSTLYLNLGPSGLGETAVDQTGGLYVCADQDLAFDPADVQANGVIGAFNSAHPQPVHGDYPCGA